MKATDSKDDWLTDEYGISRVREILASHDDALIVMCKSGHSPALRLAMSGVKAHGIPVITFSGGAPNNAIRHSGTVNFHSDDDVAGCLAKVFAP